MLADGVLVPKDDVALFYNLCSIKNILFPKNTSEDLTSSPQLMKYKDAMVFCNERNFSCSRKTPLDNLLKPIWLAISKFVLGWVLISHTNGFYWLFVKLWRTNSYARSRKLVITPITSPLNARPLVIPDKTEIRFRVSGHEENYLVSLDSKLHL
jgi:NAD+ kinase